MKVKHILLWFLLEVDRYGFFMADADADFLQSQDSRWPIYDADFFFCRYVWLVFFFSSIW